MLSGSLLQSLNHNEKQGTNVAKTRARLIHEIDRQSTIPLSTKELHEILLSRGLDLKPERIRQARLIWELLHALDPKDHDPPEVAHINDAETLCLLQKAHTRLGTPYQALLEQISTLDKSSSKSLLKSYASGEQKPAERWTSPLPKVPQSLANRLNKAVGSWRKEAKLTPVQSMEEICSFLEAATPEGLKILGDDRLTSALQLIQHQFQCKPTEAVEVLLEVVSVLEGEHWDRLYKLQYSNQ